MLLSFLFSTELSFPSLAITLFFLSVTILSTFATEIMRKPFVEEGLIKNSAFDNFAEIKEDIAQTVMSLYLSFVKKRITAGLTFTFDTSEKGKGMRTISPEFISCFS